MVPFQVSLSFASETVSFNVKDSEDSGSRNVAILAKYVEASNAYIKKLERRLKQRNSRNKIFRDVLIIYKRISR